MRSREGGRSGTQDQGLKDRYATADAVEIECLEPGDADTALARAGPPGASRIVVHRRSAQSRRVQLAPTPARPYLDPSRTGSDWLLDPAQQPLPKVLKPGIDATVDPSAGASDVRAFGELLRDAYALSDQYAAAGLDLPATIERHARRVEGLTTATYGEAFVPLMRELLAAVPDNHLQVWLDKRNARQNWRERDPLLARREFRGPADALAAATAVSGVVKNTGYSAPTLAMSDGRDGAAQLRPTGSVVLQGSQNAGEARLRELGYRPVEDIARVSSRPGPDKPAYDFRAVGDTGYITLASFNSSDPETAAQLDRFVADVPRHRELRRIFIDMRGNGGGNDGYVGAWISGMRSKATQLKPFTGIAYASGRQQHVTDWNLWAEYAATLPGQVPGFEERAKRSQASWPLSEATPRVPIDGDDWTGSADSDWTGDVFVLVDRGSGSSGESAALMLREWMDATLVGERTSGTLMANNSTQHELPATGLGVQIPTGRKTYDDARIVEGGGIPVDVFLDQPSAPLERVAGALSQLSVERGPSDERYSAARESRR